MPCAQRTAAEARARDIAARRVDVDRFAGVSDVVEILRLIHAPTAWDPLKNFVPYARTAADLYRAISQHDADRLVRAASGHEELLRTVAGHLAAFADVDLTMAQEALLEREDPYPAHVFRGAGEGVVGRLFDLLDTGVATEDRLRLNHPLCALAWELPGLVQEQLDEVIRQDGPHPYRERTTGRDLTG